MDPPPQSARTIDHFRIKGRLGMGGMGVVYRAEDLLLRRPVALKVMRPEHMTDARRRARFLREARTAASLVHPNVATIYEVGETEGTIFIAMELVAGESLRAILSRGRVDVKRALRWSLGIARALACAHEAGIVHRDLKPDNVMVLPDDEVKLLDFGIAKALAADSNEQAPVSVGLQSTAEQMTLEGAVVGTPQYVSPEQARGEAVGVRSDVFSFGTLLFELLTGISPFRRGTVIETLAAVARDPVPLAGEKEPAVPAEVAAIVAQCLEKDPGDRFAGGAEVLAALRAVVDGTTTPGREETAEETATEAPLPRPPATEPERPRAETSAPATARAASRSLVLVAATFAVLAAAGMLALRSRAAASRAEEARRTSGDASRCTSSAACSRAHGNGAWRCQSGRHECVEIGSPECKVLANEVDLASDDTVWIGAMFPTTGAAATDVAPELRAIDLARRDFAEALGSSAARDGGLHARPIAVVVCDESTDPVRAARHLAEDVEVPAVIGFRWAKSALATIPTELLPDHVLSFVSVSQAAELTKIPQAKGEPRLVWRSTLNVADTARPLARLIDGVLEPKARAAGLGDRAMRVALVRTSAGTRDLTDTLFRELRFNGKSALENGEDFRQFVFDAMHDGGAEVESLVSSLLDFAPQVVVYQGTSFVREVLVPLEKRWHRGPRPTYLVNSDMDDDAVAFVGSDAERRRRFFGVTNVSTTVTNAELVLHYNLAYSSEPVTRTSAPQPSYDAFYALAYAAEAIDGDRVDGPGLSRALDRLLPPGPRIEVGPGGILEGFQVLRSGGRIDLEGAIGSLDFDPATGDAPIDYAVLCMGLNDRGRAFASVESGLVYDAKTKALKGALKCP